MQAGESRHANWQTHGVDDFVLLSEISETAFMENLKKRYDNDKIYSYIGPVVIAVNPYKIIPDMYTPKLHEDYRGRFLYELPPHVYAIADEAYREMLANHTNQTIIISGESGAGKTESAKHVMQHIAAISGSGAKVEGVKAQLLGSNPLLEAFGNAKTNRNDNSSRFGKYMEIQFNFKGDPTGGRITNYLLEKIRVVKQAPGERNFHIFYQILKSTGAELAQWSLNNDPSQYNYLRQGEASVVKTVDDVKDLAATKQAMKVVGFKPQEQDNIFRVVAGIIQLGQTTFTGQGKDPAAIGDSSGISIFSQILGVNKDQLAQALVRRTITTPTERSVVNLDKNKAEYARDAIAKAIYSRLFNEIVRIANDNIQGEVQRVIGILDIYGFEIFRENSFEQLCINYCNEKLQQYFIELTLKSEQEEYVREGIAWTPVDYFNNEIICDMIEKKPVGLFAFLDEASLLDAPDKAFLEKLDKNFAKHAHYASASTDKALNVQFKGLQAFKLKHYAGDVVYNVDGFVDKNADNLWRDLNDVMSQSSNVMLKALFPAVADSKQRPPTSATVFKASMVALVDTLKLCQPHYIRCIKPNETKAAREWQSDLCVHQVRYLGLMENVRVRRAGFAFRAPFDRFIFRYKCLTKETWPNWRKDVKSGIEVILRHCGIKGGHQYGNTKLFLKEPTDLFKLEEQRTARLPSLATDIQRCVRGWLQRIKFRRLRAAMAIQKHYRGLKQRESHRRLLAAVYVQKMYRAFAARENFQRQKSAFLLTRLIRAALARDYLADVMKKVGTIQHLRGTKDFHEPAAWPKTKSVVMEKSNALLKPSFLWWKCKSYYESIGKATRQTYEIKFAVMKLFSGKKPYALPRSFSGDYAKRTGNEKTQLKLDQVRTTLGSEGILFSEMCFSGPNHKKYLPFVLFLTSKNCYLLDGKAFKLPKQGAPVSDIIGVSMSPGDDQWLVLHNRAGNDRIIYLQNQDQSELVYLLTTLVKELPVNFKEKIDFKFGNGKKQTQLSFKIDEVLTQKTATNLAAGKPPLFKPILKGPELTLLYPKF